jgi:AcrR family transcriptional regulator
MTIKKTAADTKTFILETALRLFLSKGYKDVSYQDLMKKTGLSKGAIYHHFASKEDILVSVFEFFLKSAGENKGPSPDGIVKDIPSFKKLFLGIKKEQFDQFKKMMGGKDLKFNKLLFFLEAIMENKKLIKTVEKLLQQEITFLEESFKGLEKHGKLAKGKDRALLAKNLFWMMQGAESMLLYKNGKDLEKDFLAVYSDTLDDFFKMIK